MIRFYDRTTLQTTLRMRVSMRALGTALVGSSLLFAAVASAATIDFNTAVGNYDSALDPDAGATPNWIDTTQAVPAAPPAVPPTNAAVGIPAASDDAFVRNGGTATITSAVVNNSFGVGAARTVYTDDGVNVIQNEAGGNGTVNMLSGSLSGSGANGLALRLGGVGLSAAGSPVFTGTFNQSGGTVNLSVGGNPGSVLVIGSQGTTASPTSAYNMTGGQIKMTYDAGNHVGINVRNGTFYMAAGSITNNEADGVGNYDQRFMTISSTSGPSNAQHNVSSATFTGSAVVDVHHGIRVAPNNRAEGYLTLSGGASIKLGNDLQLAANAGTAGSVDAAYGQFDMSGGYLQVGQYTATASTFEKKFIIGDAGRGVFTQTGGSVLVGDVLRMSNNAVSSGLMTMKDPVGGPTGIPFTFTTRNVETRNTATTDATLNSDVIIDSVDARFIQTNMVNTGTGLTLLGSTRIGGNGKSTFEIRKGDVRFGQVAVPGVDFGGNLELSGNAGSRATLNLLGGKLTIGGNVTRTNTATASTPVVNLSGGQLVLDPQLAAPTAVAWQTDFKNIGSQITTRPGALLTVNVGVGTTLPGNFEMSGGSWDLDIGPGAGFLANGSDRFVMLNTSPTPGTGKLLGGTLNLNYLGGYVPAFGDSRTIVRAATGGSVTLGSIAINAPGGDSHWIAETVGLDIRLTYVPEPASFVMAAVGLLLGIGGIRRRP
ncbi:MAG: hypothetical protein U0805_11160 [Pirellulales bacterium]